MLTINDIPDVPMLIILDNVPMYDLLRSVPFVNRRWAFLQFQTCITKNSLQLKNKSKNGSSVNVAEMSPFYGIDPNQDLMVQYQNYRYNLRHHRSKNEVNFDITLNLTSCVNFCQKFKNLTHLTLSNESYDSTEILHSILAQCKSTLTHLTIVGDFEWSNLKSEIDQMKMLRCLSISSDIYCMVELSIIVQLDQFYCAFQRVIKSDHEDENRKDFYKTINRLIGKNVRAFGLEQGHCLYNINFNDSGWTNEIARKLTRFKVTIRDEINFAKMCIKSPLLNHLDLTLCKSEGKLKLDQIMAKLSQLTQLTHLKLHITGELDDQLDERIIQNLKPLSSVKTVELNLTVNPHLYPIIERFLFPNVTKSVILRILYYHLKSQLDSLPCRIEKKENPCETCKVMQETISGCIKFNLYSNLEIYFKNGHIVGHKNVL